ncbi:MAG: hypothetical protein JWM19_792 [Actinomycetia bacterium]|nr:hypothetical protein [Actinomycetes bacterium]
MKSARFNRAITALITGAAALCLPLNSALATPAAQASPAAVCSPALAKVALSPASVPGGAGSTVTATLNCATPRALSVALKGFSGVRVPSVLHVAAGKTTGTAAIATATTTKAKRGWILATLGNVRREALLTIGVTPKTCKSPVLAATTLPTLAYVGDHPVLTVKLSCTAAATVKVTLTGSVTPSDASLTVPTSVSIGKYYSVATVALSPKAYRGYMPGQYKAAVSARLGSRDLTRVMTVDPGLLIFDDTPDSCSPNDVSLDILFTGDVPAGGLTVKLKSSNAAVTVPATYTFTQQGSVGGGVNSGVRVEPVSKATNVTLSASLGSRTMTVSVTLLPPWQAGDKITLTPEIGSNPFYGPSGGYTYGIGLSDPAPTSGNGLNGTVSVDPVGAVQLTNPEFSIFPGCDSASFSFNVPAAITPVHATITVAIGGSKATTSVIIEPSIASVTAPATIVGGQSGMGTVTLAGVPDAPETVYLESSDKGILTVPTPVTIPAGQKSVTFSITTVPVTEDSQVFFQAWHSVGSQTADTANSNNIDVTPAP